MSFTPHKNKYVPKIKFFERNDDFLYIYYTCRYVDIFSLMEKFNPNLAPARG